MVTNAMKKSQKLRKMITCDWCGKQLNPGEKCLHFMACHKEFKFHMEHRKNHKGSQIVCDTCGKSVQSFGELAKKHRHEPKENPQKSGYEDMAKTAKGIGDFIKLLMPSPETEDRIRESLRRSMRPPIDTRSESYLVGHEAGFKEGLQFAADMGVKIFRTPGPMAYSAPSVPFTQKVGN